MPQVRAVLNWIQGVLVPLNFATAKRYLGNRIALAVLPYGSSTSLPRRPALSAPGNAYCSEPFLWGQHLVRGILCRGSSPERFMLVHRAAMIQAHFDLFL